jgi:hypothetical protein
MMDRERGMRRERWAQAGERGIGESLQEGHAGGVRVREQDNQVNAP